MTQILIPPEDFENDLEHNLGRANGNVYQRIPGTPGINDGQIMVRLKKKRFIILDYSIVPKPEDMQVAESRPFINIPNGAGRTKCNTPECTKIGVPVCLYDSDPSEPDSLYLRSGLCFSCQRHLNEKRRTERKRPGKGDTEDHPNLIYAFGPSAKKFKVNGNLIHLKSDAIVINGAVEGTRQYGEGYGFQEIGLDLISLTQEAAQDTNRLVRSISNDASAAAMSEAGSNEATQSGKLENGVAIPGVHQGSGPSRDDINALYYRAFQSLNKSIFLLSQWRASWDASVGTADEAAETKATPAGLKQEQSANMASLLLAADNRRKDSEANALVEHQRSVANSVNGSMDGPLQHGLHDGDYCEPIEQFGSINSEPIAHYMPNYCHILDHGEEMPEHEEEIQQEINQHMVQYANQDDCREETHHPPMDLQDDLQGQFIGAMENAHHMQEHVNVKTHQNIEGDLPVSGHVHNFSDWV